MKRELITAATLLPVSVTFCKQHSGIELGDDDKLILHYIRAAVGYVEGVTGVNLLAQTWRYYYDSFPACFEMGISDVTAVAIAYDDENDSEQTLATSVYHVDDKADPIAITLKSSQSWPATYEKPNCVRVDVTAGQAAQSTVDDSIKQAIVLLVGHWYDNRAATDTMTVKTIPFSVKSLLNINKKWRSI